MATYDFGTQLARGEARERELDRAQALAGYRVRPATRDEQRQGIDRWVRRKTPGAREFAVEYKADERAHRTGNAFIETVSVDTAEKAGWAYTSQAQYVMYYVPGDLLVYIVELDTLRLELPRWERRYPKATAQNDGYRTHGVLVPLRELERIANAIWTL